MKVYGPYEMKSGRLYVTIRYDDGRQRTVSYPKFLVEQELGRELGPDETVDHIDRTLSPAPPLPITLYGRRQAGRTAVLTTKYSC